jgi:hypothetical protein
MLNGPQNVRASVSGEELAAAQVLGSTTANMKSGALGGDASILLFVPLHCHSRLSCWGILKLRPRAILRAFPLHRLSIRVQITLSRCTGVLLVLLLTFFGFPWSSWSCVKFFAVKASSTLDPAQQSYRPATTVTFSVTTPGVEFQGLDHQKV